MGDSQDTNTGRHKSPVQVFLKEFGVFRYSSAVYNSDLYLVIESDDDSLSNKILLAPITTRKREICSDFHRECKIGYFVRKSDPGIHIMREFQLDYLEQVIERLIELEPALTALQTSPDVSEVRIGHNRYDPQKIREFQGIVAKVKEARERGEFPRRPSLGWPSSYIAELFEH